MEESEIIKRSAEGDMRAFEMLVQKYQSGIINHAYIMLGNREDAFDMAQETFIRAYCAIGTFGRQSSFKTWLYKIATNVCFDEIRRRKRRIKTVNVSNDENDTTENIVQADESTNPENILSQKELSEVIFAAVESLGDDYREVISLREYAKMDYKEIAKTLGISLGTVKSRLSRARSEIAKKIAKYMELL